MSKPSDVFRVRWRGVVTGPFPRDVIGRMLRTGSISPSHQVSADGVRWRSVRDEPALADFLTPQIPEVHSPAREDSLEDDGWSIPGVRIRIPGEKQSIPQSVGPVASTMALNHAASEHDNRSTLLLALFSTPGVSWSIAFGLLPLCISLLHEFLGWGFGRSAWLIAGYFCLLWAVYFHAFVRPRRDVWHLGLGYASFTATAGILALLVWQQLPWVAALYSGTESGTFLFRLTAFIFGVGLFEETCKMLPFFLFGLKRSGGLQAGEGVFLGALSGLGFAWNEGVRYSLSYWQGNAEVSAGRIAECVAQAQRWWGAVDAETFAQLLTALIPRMVEDHGSTVLVQFVRFVSLPLLHAAWSGAVGFFVVRAFRENRWGSMFLGLAGAALLHGVYDVFSDNVIGIVVAGASVLFALGCVVYSRAGSSLTATDELHLRDLGREGA